MENIRNDLLRKNSIDAYCKMITFFEDPIRTNIDDVIESLDEELQNKLICELNALRQFYKENRNLYDEEYKYGQAIIWQEVLFAYNSMVVASQKIANGTLCPDISNYSIAAKDIARVLNYYAEMQIALSNLEQVLGVDRFLDRISRTTFDVLEEMLKKEKSDIEEKTNRYKSFFQQKWNTTNIHKLIRHKLVSPDNENQICDLSQSGCKELILFVIDGFGYSQYLWNRGCDINRKNYTFNENIFYWMSRENLSHEYILGSSYITDTGAGLAQIFLGQMPGETGIIASKIWKRGGEKTFYSAKTISPIEYDSLFLYKNSITDIISLYEKPVTVYYCSKYQEPPSGFSKCIFKSANIKQVLPSERVFSILLDDISAGEETGLKVVYLTGIDNSGHTMGAYSNFERYEHQKISYLFRNFLIELANNNPSYFDGTRSILITADHGMFESSKKIISRTEITDYLSNAGINHVKQVENNRAMLFYNEGFNTNKEIKTCLEQFFKEKQLHVEVQDKDVDSYSHCLDNCEYGLMPDLIARFVGEGLFYTNLHHNAHLLHFGGHGGYSIDEVFVPLIEIPLDEKLFNTIQKRFLSRK